MSIKEYIIDSLKSLKRYDVGTGDDGDGFQYDNENPDGEWVKASDVDGAITAFEIADRRVKI